MSSCNRYTHNYRDVVTIKSTAAVVLTNRYIKFAVIDGPYLVGSRSKPKEL